MSMKLEQAQSISPIKRALLALETMQGKLDAIKYRQKEPIAIVGMGCRFPGQANDPDSYWKILKNGIDTISEVPTNRWNLEQYYDPEPDTPGKMYARHGGFLEQVDSFDAHFFGISAREAISLEPQQRLFLEVSWEALENANQAAEQLHNSQTGVFLGICANDYARRILKPEYIDKIDAYFGTGNTLSLAAGRLSYLLGLKGPSLAIDTACSSSLVAVHLACQSLRQQECSLALAGGVNLLLSPETSITFSRARMLSPDGRCKTFDATADGYVRGEGCGVVVLKRLSDAQANQDRIFAVIRGSAMNHNGRSNSLISPNGPAQQAVIRQALQNSNVEPAQVSYVEVQGTGTAWGGDAIEVEALNSVFGQNRPEDQPLVIASAKTNIGHLEGAAGIASLMKVILQLQHEEICAHLHFQQPNPQLDWDKLPVKVPTKPLPWLAGEQPRLAGVSAFGFSGTNAHLVIEEAPKIELAQSSPTKIDRPLHLLTLSAKTETALEQLVAKYEKYLASEPNLAIADICFSANTGRSHFKYRLSLASSSVTELLDQLRAWQTERRGTGIVQGQVKKSTQPSIAFLFTGEDSEYIAKGSQLYHTQPTFRVAMDRCAEILGSLLAQPPTALQLLEPQSGTISSVREDLFRQITLFSWEYSLAELWQSWGIKPSAVMGYGVGEYAAATIAGILNLEDALKLIIKTDNITKAEKDIELSKTSSEISYSAPRIGFISSTTGKLASTEVAAPQYWCNDRPQAQQSADGIEHLKQKGYEVLLEMGLYPSWPKMSCRQLSEEVNIWLPSVSLGQGDWHQLLHSLATLYVMGVKVDWQGFDRDYSRHKRQLPTYPWQRQRYWFEPDEINQSQGTALNNQFLSLLQQTDSKQVIQQLENTAEFSTEELKLLAKLIPKLAQQYSQQILSEPRSEPKFLTAKDIQTWLVECIARELGVTPENINIQEPFDSYGLDSVLALEIASAGKQFLGLDFSPLLLVHYPTIESLTQHLAQELEASATEILEI